MNWAEQTNTWFKLWAESQKNLFRAVAEGKGITGLESDAASETSSMQKGMRELNDLWKSSIETWMGLVQQGSMQSGADASHATNMMKLFDLGEWAKAGTGTFDLALEHLAEGPTYATLWDLDRKLLNTQRLWQQRSKDVTAYYALVQAAWSKAFARFTEELNDPAGEPIKSWRALLDLWIKVSNDTLLEVHRSEPFLEAQRRMTRSSTEYRLAEREIAEAFCEKHHVPTRTEVDEVQRIVCELRREVRALKRELAAVRVEPRMRVVEQAGAPRRNEA